MSTSGTILHGWWDRLRGRLQPSPFPMALSPILETRWRRLVADPKQIVERFGIRAGERVLEIGPGTGYYSSQLQKTVGDSGKLICIDIQYEMLSATRHRLLADGQMNVGLVQADATAIPLRHGTLDHVVLVGVLGELPDHVDALRALRELLRVGGRISISEQLPDPDFVTKRTLRREMRLVGFREEATAGVAFYTSTWVRFPESQAQQAIG